MIILVTGGLGFIGKHFIQCALQRGHFVKNIDCINYAADVKISDEFTRHPNYRLIHADVVDLEFIPECDVVVHFAAESHVDASISSNAKFVRSNIVGTQKLLELIRGKAYQDTPLYLQISTDEVYGDNIEGSFDENALLKPSNPYSATKAAADMLVMSWGRTYGLPWNIARPTNNYGCHQYPEKLIPKAIGRLKRGRPIPLHGDGSYIRTWLHADDTAEALFRIIEDGARQTIYNVSGDEQHRNIDVARKLCALLGVPAKEGQGWVFSGDRAGQDVRYSVDDAKLRRLGWRPTRRFDEELVHVVETHEFNRFQ